MSNRKDIIRIIFSVLLCMIVLSVTPIMFSTCADEVLPIVTIRIRRITKIDDIEGLFEGEADWHYYIWVRTGQKYLESDKKCEKNKDTIKVLDAPYIYETHTFKVETVSICFWFFLLEEDFPVSAPDLADISSCPGGGQDNVPESLINPTQIQIFRGAVYNASYDLKTDKLGGDEIKTDVVAEILEGEAGWLITSGNDDGSWVDGDENDAEISFSISDNYDPPVATVTIGSDQPIYTGDIVYFDGSASTASNGSSITKFEWDFESDGLVDALGEKTSFAYNKEGNYAATLKVTDSLGETSTDTFTITVTNPGGIIGGPSWIDDIVVFGAIAAVAGLSGIVVRSRILKKKA